jgi:hypothetical protein
MRGSGAGLAPAPPANPCPVWFPSGPDSTWR